MKHPSTNKIAKTAIASAKIAELTADLQRLQAEFINYKNRAELERMQAVQVGKEQAVIALLPIIDSIERAIEHEPKDIKAHNWVKGITVLAKQLDNQLEAIGLKKIGKIGEVFDPARHEAVVLDDGEGETEVISGVIQTGYQFGEDIIRPAIVKVKKV
jgi:molecular chaperone GrpE